MYVYLDESGDTGFKFDKNSTRFFVVTLLLVDDPDPIRAAVSDLRNNLGLPWYREFHFVHCSNEIRRSFLRHVCQQDFRIRAVVIDKTKMTRAHMRNGETFYNFVVKMVLHNDFGSIQDATLILDESVKSRKRKDSSVAYLRRELNSAGVRRVKRIRYVASHADDLLQAADMISGAINRKFARGDSRFYNLIIPRIDDIWEWKPYQIN